MSLKVFLIMDNVTAHLSILQDYMIPEFNFITPHYRAVTETGKRES